MSEANVPKVGHGPKMGRNEFDCACVSVVFTCSLLVLHKAHIAPIAFSPMILQRVRYIFPRF